MRRIMCNVGSLKRPALLVGSVLLFAMLVLATYSRVSAKDAGHRKYGSSLQDWMLLYSTWELGGTDIQPDANGNADVGHTVLLAVPSAPGDGTPASINITLKPGQGFAVPFGQWVGNAYEDGSEDPMANPQDFKDVTVKLDGKTIISSKNFLDYYTEDDFDPPLTTDISAPAVSWIFEQSVGIVHGPLCVGKHTLTLDESIDFSDLGFTSPIVYHNTWNITVKH